MNTTQTEQTELQRKLAGAMTMFEFYERRFKRTRDMADFRVAKFWVAAVNKYVRLVQEEQAGLK